MSYHFAQTPFASSMASKSVGPDLFVGGELLVLDLVGDAGDVHQVVIVDVLADAVAAPGAAAEGRGRVQAVVHRAAEARAANLVDAVTGNIHAGRDIFNVLLGVGMDHAAVAGAFHVEVRAGDLNSVFPALAALGTCAFILFYPLADSRPK